MTKNAEEARRQLLSVGRSAEGASAVAGRRVGLLEAVKRFWTAARRKKPPQDSLRELGEVVLWLFRAAILFGAAYQLNTLVLH